MGPREYELSGFHRKLGRRVTSLNSHMWMRVLKLEPRLLTPATEATRDEAKHGFLTDNSFILWAWT